MHESFAPCVRRTAIAMLRIVRFGACEEHVMSRARFVHSHARRGVCVLEVGVGWVALLRVSRQMLL